MNVEPRRLDDQKGSSLIELMIALVIGLLVVGAAGAIFVTNSQTFRATQSLSRLQENSRSAFELMSRDIREARANPCNTGIATTMLLAQPANAFWTDWDSGVLGVEGSVAFANPVQAFGTGAAARVTGTDAVEVKLATASGGQVTAQMANKTADLTVSSLGGIEANDVVMVCDFDLISVFQATSVSATTISHDAAGNCTSGFTDKNPCAGGPPSAAAWHRYDTDAVIAVPQSQRWYVGNNGRGGTSLYRTTVRGGGGGLKALDTQEIVEDVTSMRLSYLVAGASQYVGAAAVTAADWSKVTAVRIQMQFTGEKTGVNDAPIARALSHTVSLRNHLL